MVEDFALKNPGMQYSGIGAATMVVRLNQIIAEGLDDLYARVEKRINQATSGNRQPWWQKVSQRLSWADCWNSSEDDCRYYGHAVDN